eukprot:CAMPEP_0204055362 /NCGR_PEP_ID=MMETSP0360-20130528/130330_1 /ASSEMBLY_ACC=CAM_ASM_000342 /TAXON_ID=268821 /ORGANISM="Scrippsiella Hangoei, Strain SHTV-5" /LENGTH=61 /DNA_ID=CAMNT_0051002707 /DNA_START=200 /DNA_END=383 /DNA_ORIENTATION=+
MNVSAMLRLYFSLSKCSRYLCLNSSSAAASATVGLARGRGRPDAAADERAGRRASTTASPG